MPVTDDSFDYDSLQESQLLYGERVVVFEEKNGWSRVEAAEQPEWTHHEKWEGYPGWIRSDHLAPLPQGQWGPDAVITVPLARVYQDPSSNSPILLDLFMGTKIVMDSHVLRGNDTEPSRSWQSILLIDGNTGWISKDQITPFVSLHQLSTDQVRQRIVQNTRSLEGTPYYWGGLSQGVDCSGLVHLAYRAAGIDLPRDAHEQFMKSRRIEKEQLQPADLTFLSSEKDPTRMSHVMLYVGSDNIIEGPGTGKFVHQIPLNEKLSQNSHRKVYYATYFPKN